MSEAPSHYEVVNRDLFVEPLGGPEQVEVLLKNFPDSVYDKSPSSRFYKFFYALVGPSGIGQLVRNYFRARLILLESNVELFDIEKFYSDPFRFGRILEEQPDQDPSSWLTLNEWEKIQAQDSSYRSRALDFLAAVRLGTHPQGMRMAAKSGLGTEVSIFERYSWMFDQLSDQPIGVKNYGNTLSLNEFVVMPRPVQYKSNIQQLVFESTVSAGQYIIEFLGHRTSPISFDADAFEIQKELRDLPSIGKEGVIVTGGKAPLPFTIKFVGNLDTTNIGPLLIKNSSLQDSTGKTSLVRVTALSDEVNPVDQSARVPERLLKNMQSALDRLRPVSSYFSFEPSEGTVVNRAYKVESSSNYVNPIRFVTGNPQVNWPPVDEKFWIEQNVEKEAKQFYQNESAHYTHFHKIEKVTVDDNGLTDSSLMIELNPDPKPVINGYVNGIYPIEYFGISKSSDLALQEKESYWVSLQRAYPNTEIIKVDLGTARPTNFISFDINNRPVEVKFQYCVWNNGEEEYYESATSEDTTFSGLVRDRRDKTKWKHLENRFLDKNGSIPVTRYIKIIIDRLDDQPFDENEEFSIEVKSLKVGRSILL